MKSLCVFCGSSFGRRLEYGAAAESLGRLLAQRGASLDPLVAALAHSVVERFVRPEHQALLLVDASAERLLERFAAHAPPALPKWIGPEQS